MTKLLRAAAAVAVCALAVAVGRGGADAAETGVSVAPTVEAWYQPNPTCALPVGCVTPNSALSLVPVPTLPVPVGLPIAIPALPAIPLSPYPAGTLHVAYSGGQETARAYLAFPREKLAGEVVSASLDIPLDTAPANGSLQPETAHAQACLFSSDIVAIEGSIEDPPAVACDGSAPLTYVATPQPHLHASLAALKDGLGTTTGLAILPNAKTVTPTDAWHVAFSAHTRTGATPAATLTAVVRPFAEDETAPVDAIEEFELGTFDDSFASPSVAPTRLPQGSSDAVALRPATPATTVTVGYAYAVVWLLPLVALGVVPAIARVLTKDLRNAR